MVSFALLFIRCTVWLIKIACKVIWLFLKYSAILIALVAGSVSLGAVKLGQVFRNMRLARRLKHRKRALQEPFSNVDTRPVA